jgi:hypothetical protein
MSQTLKLLPSIFSCESLAVESLDASRGTAWHLLTLQKTSRSFRPVCQVLEPTQGSKLLSGWERQACCDLCVCPTRLFLSSRDQPEGAQFHSDTRTFGLNFPAGKCLITEPFLTTDRSTSWMSPCVWAKETSSQRKCFPKVNLHIFVSFWSLKTLKFLLSEQKMYAIARISLGSDGCHVSQWRHNVNFVCLSP